MITKNGNIDRRYTKTWFKALVLLTVLTIALASWLVDILIKEPWVIPLAIGFLTVGCIWKKHTKMRLQQMERDQNDDDWFAAHQKRTPQRKHRPRRRAQTRG